MLPFFYRDPDRPKEHTMQGNDIKHRLEHERRTNEEIVEVSSLSPHTKIRFFDSLKNLNCGTVLSHTRVHPLRTTIRITLGTHDIPSENLCLVNKAE